MITQLLETSGCWRRLNLQRLRISQRTSCPIMPHPNMAIRKGSSSNDDEVIVKLLLDVCGGL